MIQKVSGGGFEHVKIFGLRVIKFLIDGLIVGNILADNIDNYKIKVEKTGKKEENILTEQKFKCEKCEKGMKLHMTRTQEEKNDECESCEISFDSSEDFGKHKELIHGDISSPLAKKQKQSTEEMEIEFSEQFEDTLKELEFISWEERRFNIDSQKQK